MCTHRVTDGHFRKPVRQLAANTPADTCPTGLVQIGRPAGMQLSNGKHPALYSQPSIGIGNLGHHRFLVIPNHHVQGDGVFQLTQTHIEEIVKKGATLPLETTDSVQGLGMTETGSLQQNHLPTDSTTQLGDNIREKDTNATRARPPTQRLPNNKDAAWMKVPSLTRWRGASDQRR